MLIFFSRFLYLLIVPLTRGVIALLSGGLLAWIEGAWVDILILFSMFTLAYQVWNHLYYRFDERGIQYTSGIFVCKNTFIPMDKISLLGVHTPLLLRPFRMANLRIDTLARTINDPDLSFFVTTKEANRILALRRAPYSRAEKIEATFSPGIRSLLGLCLFTSNTFIGIILLVTFITQFGKLLGEQFANLFIGFLEELARGLVPVSQLIMFVFRIQPLALLIGLLLLCGWFVAFIANLLNLKGLEISRTATSLYIQGGISTHKNYCLLLSDIVFVDLRQSLLTRLLKLHSVYIDAVGFGKTKSGISAIVPFSHENNCLKHLSKLLFEYRPSPRQLKPNAGAIMKFLLDPLWPCLLVPLATFLAASYFRDWASLIYFVGFMCSIPAYWFMGVRLLDFFSSGASRDNEIFTLRYSNTFYLHTVVFSFDKIALINIRQSILQRGDKKCDLVVSTKSETRKKHHVRNLDWDAAAKLFDAVDPQPFQLKIGFWDKIMLFFNRVIQFVNK